MNYYIILNDRGEFWCGNWSSIKFTPEFPGARIYKNKRLAVREADKLTVEVPGTFKVVENYGLENEKVVTLS